MPTAVLDGISTYYEVVGSGPPLLMFSPGGFNATLRNWHELGIYRKTQPLDELSQRYRCIVFDRRESGRSGGRVEHLTWHAYVAQARALLDHLGIDRAHLYGGCQGCAPVTAFAVTHPETVLSLVLYWPVGGARYRIRNHQQFGQHLAYVSEHGLEQVVALARSSDVGFSKDPRIGLWGPVLRSDPDFAQAYVEQDPERYAFAVGATVRSLVDRDTALGADAEDLLRLDVPALIVPGSDASHATSAAMYLSECIPGAEYWDAPVAEQTAETAPARVLQFLDGVSSQIA